MKKRGKRAQIAIDKIIGWSIAILVLVLIIALYFILKTKGINLLDYVKNIVRFGR